MTLQELKENRTAIIREIDRVGGAHLIKPVMEQLLKVYKQHDEWSIYDALVEITHEERRKNHPRIDMGVVNKERAAKNMGSKWSTPAA
jgi:hypothetical protein